MRLLRNLFVSCRPWALALLGMALLAGCETLSPNEGALAKPPQQITTDYIRVGESLIVEFLDITPPQQIQQTVLEDGSITLLLGQKVMAANKTSAELQQEIFDLYVPKFYKRLTINIKRELRYYFVSGEVKTPGKQAYTPNATVLKGIAAAGDFTVFANKKKIEVIRANGQVEIVNGDKARKNPKYDPPIYPGDQINVPLKLY